MRWLIFVLFVFTFPFTNIYSQNIRLKGRVITEKDSSYVNDAIVLIEGESDYRLTDSLGQFYYDNLQNEEIEITISKIGYYSFNSKIKLEKYSQNNYKFILKIDLLGIDDYYLSSFVAKETVKRSISNLEIHKEINSFKTLTYLEYFDLFSQLHVIKTKNGLPSIFKRGIYNNFQLQIDNALIPKDYYSELLMFLNINSGERLEINNSPAIYEYNNGASGIYNINGKMGLNRLNIIGQVNTEEYKAFSINLSNKITSSGNFIDSIKTATKLNYIPDYNYDNYNEYKNVNLRFKGELYVNNKFYNEFSIVYDKFKSSDSSPRTYNYFNTNRVNNSYLFVASVMNKLNISNNGNIILFNNYSLVDKENKSVDFSEYRLSNIVSKIYYQNNEYGKYNYVLGFENNYEKISFIKINNGYRSNNNFRFLGSGEYQLSYGKFCFEIGLQNYTDNEMYFSYIGKLKIFTSGNSDMLLGYGIKYSSQTQKDNFAFEYDYFGTLIRASDNNLKPNKINTLEAVFTYTDNDFYFLKVGFYNEIISNALIKEEITENSYLLLKNKNGATITVNTGDLLVKVIPIKNVKAGIYIYNSKLISDNIYTTIFRPEKEISLFVEYRPLINTSAELLVRHYGELQVADEYTPERNIDVSQSMKIYTLSSITVLDLLINQRVKDFNIMLAIRNMFNKEMYKYRLIYPTSVTLGIEYMINY